MTHYECDCCGACCQGHLIIEVYELDVLREPRLIEADPHYAGRSIAHVMTKLEEDGTCVILSAGKPCKFLNASNRCSIYPTRPNDCVAMQAGDEQCQKARQAARLPPLRSIAP